MFKKLIKYTDYNGNEREENFYFGLNKAEIMDMEFSVAGGMREMIQLIVARQDIPKIMESFRQLIRMSYGEKSPDGRQFIKNEKLTDAFVQTEAYVNLYMELIGDAKKASDFINGILPADVLAGMAKEEQNTEENNGDANLLDNVVSMPQTPTA